jgi:hypothetical protein
MYVYPVFVTNLTSCELRSPGQLVGCPLPCGTTNIRRLYQYFFSRQAAIEDFYAAHLWISPRPVETRPFAFPEPAQHESIRYNALGQIFNCEACGV